MGVHWLVYAVLYCCRVYNIFSLDIQREQKMRQKKLQKSSKYSQYDIDNDGIVSDEEFEHMAEIKRLEHDLRKQRAQRRMATASLVAMASFTIAMFLVDLERVKALSDISNLFYITGGGIVAAYMGASAIMNRNGK